MVLKVNSVHVTQLCVVVLANYCSPASGTNQSECNTLMGWAENVPPLFTSLSTSMCVCLHVGMLNVERLMVK